MSYSQFFKAFSNPTRLVIIKLLKNETLTVNTIAKKSGFEQSRVSHNLKCLTQCGFVNVRNRGNYREYSLDTTTIVPMLNLLDKHMKTYKQRLASCEVP